MTAVMTGLALAWVVLLRLHRKPAVRRPPAPRGPAIRSGPPVRWGRPVRSRRARWMAAATAVIVVVLLLGPLVAGAGLAAAALTWARRLTRARRSIDVRTVAELPEVVDLFVLAHTAGLTVTDSVREVGRWGTGDIAEALAGVAVAVQRGAATADALEAARDRCGRASVGLFAALVSADRYGTPLGPPLERLAHQARLDRRRAAEERARRVPVQLLFPLVVCILPAFGLLTVVPLLVDSLTSLGV